MLWRSGCPISVSRMNYLGFLRANFRFVAFGFVLTLLSSYGQTFYVALYGTEIRAGIEAYIHENDAFADPEEVATFVRIDAFNDSSIDIMVYCFTRTTVWGEWLEVKEALAYRIKEIVEGAGTAFAFPSRSLYVEALPGGAPEAFTPPRSDAS
jgi:small-conductance mechanosensitive channel